MYKYSNKFGFMVRDNYGTWVKYSDYNQSIDDILHHTNKQLMQISSQSNRQTKIIGQLEKIIAGLIANCPRK